MKRNIKYTYDCLLCTNNVDLKKIIHRTKCYNYGAQYWTNNSNYQLSFSIMKLMKIDNEDYNIILEVNNNKISITITDKNNIVFEPQSKDSETFELEQVNLQFCLNKCRECVNYYKNFEIERKKAFFKVYCPFCNKEDNLIKNGPWYEQHQCLNNRTVYFNVLGTKIYVNKLKDDTFYNVHYEFDINNIMVQWSKKFIFHKDTNKYGFATRNADSDIKHNFYFEKKINFQLSDLNEKWEEQYIRLNSLL